MTTIEPTAAASLPGEIRTLESQRRILELVAGSESLDEILGQVALLIEDSIADSICCIMLHERITHRVSFGAGPNLPEEFREAIREIDVGPRGASSGAAVHHGKTVVVEDIAGNPIWRDLQDAALGSGLRSCWSVPIRLPDPERPEEQRVVGTLDFYFRTIRKYSEARLGALESASALAGSVLSNARTQVNINQKANYDALTDLPSRALFMQRLQALIEEKRRDNGSEQGRFAVVALDLDKFKSINDTLGFQMGDLLLQALGQRLVGSLREYDTVSRAGGDDFALLVQDLRRDDDIALVADKILSRVNDPYEFGGHGLFVTASMGISVYPWDGEDAQTLLRNAETALVYAKERGGSAYQFFRPTMAKGRPTFETWIQQARLGNELRDVLERDELRLHYQLKYSADGKKILGAEALIRWEHPTEGLISPGDFIPLAEQMGIISALGEWVIQEACKQNRKWQDSGLLRIPISVNVSAQQFRQGTLRGFIEKVLEKTGLDSKYLELEIVESLAMDDGAGLRLQQLHNLGLKLSIDDFGTGFSSLSYLARFPFDTLKIDRSFIKDIGSENDHDQDSRTLVRAILSMAKALSLDVVAEGVETEEQAAFLQENECEAIQGFFFSRPKPAREITDLLISRS